MTELEEYIKNFYSGNNSLFGRAQKPEISRMQVGQMIKANKHYVKDHVLYLKKRDLSPAGKAR